MQITRNTQNTNTLDLARNRASRQKKAPSAPNTGTADEAGVKNRPARKASKGTANGFYGQTKEQRAEAKAAGKLSAKGKKDAPKPSQPKQQKRAQTPQVKPGNRDSGEKKRGKKGKAKGRSACSSASHKAQALTKRSGLPN